LGESLRALPFFVSAMRLRRLSFLVGAIAIVEAIVSAHAAPEPIPSGREVIARVRRYVDAWRPRLAELVAEEEYGQDGGDDAPRVLVSDFATVRADDGTWVGFRDVWKVDGRELPDRPSRTQRLFGPGRPDWVTARQIIVESARHNVGGRVRDFNNPIAPLELFAESRGWCCRVRARPVQGRGATEWLVEVNERTRPTLIRTPEGKPAYARAQALVDPQSGALRRLELRVGAPDPMTLSVTFVYHEALAIWLPDEMTESFRDLGRPARGRARYRHWRRFSATSRIVPN
jgi:hypothetical protein